MFELTVLVPPKNNRFLHEIFQKFLEAIFAVYQSQLMNCFLYTAADFSSFVLVLPVSILEIVADDFWGTWRSW